MGHLETGAEVIDLESDDDDLEITASSKADRQSGTSHPGLSMRPRMPLTKCKIGIEPF